VRGVIIALGLLTFILAMAWQFDQLEPECKRWDVERKRVYSPEGKACARGRHADL
jgi:hypothetical protein